LKQRWKNEELEGQRASGGEEEKEEEEKDHSRLTQ